MNFLDSESDLQDDALSSPEHYYSKPMPFRQKAVIIVLLSGFLLFFTSYLILLILKLDHSLPITFIWSYLTIPSCLSIIFLCFSALYFISVETKKILNPGKCILQTLVVMYSFCITIFVILLDLQLDESIHITYGVIFTPLFIILGLTMYLLCFLFPAIMEKKPRYLKEGTLMVMDFLLATAFIILLCLRLDGKINWKIHKIFGFLFALVTMHLMFMILEVRERGIKQILKDSILLFGIVFICTFISLHMNKTINVSWFIILSPIIIAVLVSQYLVIKHLSDLLTVKRD